MPTPPLNAVFWFPPGDQLNLFSGFVQDDVTLVPERLKLTLGTKIEHTQFAGTELEILHDKVALRGSWRRCLLSGGGAFAE